MARNTTGSSILAPILHIASEDLKDRYADKRRGTRRLKAYVRSVETARKIDIAVEVKPNGTVDIVFDPFGTGNRQGLTEAKRDIQGEACSDRAAKKYEDPPEYLPSVHIKDKKVSAETCKEMHAEDQRRLQSKTPKIVPLTIDEVEKHDAKDSAGPLQLRQFGCPTCMHWWWRTVLKSKPVSRCKGPRCGNTRYDALPRDKEFGIGRFICPNPNCGRRFFGYCEATEELKCRKCGSLSTPHIHPKWKKRRYETNLNPGAKPFKPSRPRAQPPEDYGPQFVPKSGRGFGGGGGGGGVGGGVGGTYYSSDYSSALKTFSGMNLGEESDTSRSSSRHAGQSQSPQQPRIHPRRKRRIFNASTIHQSTGGTMSTFLSQMDFDANAEEVVLDYSSDDDEEKVGACKFECFSCSNEYTVICRMMDKAKCYNCDVENRPLSWAPPRNIQSETNSTHSCSRCNGMDRCPNLKYQDGRRDA